MSRIFQTRTLKICQNAPEKNLSHSFPHTRKIFLPPPPLITHARVESHPSPPPPPLSSDLRRIVVTRGSRAKSHVTLLPFPPFSPPPTLCWWNGPLSSTILLPLPFSHEYTDGLCLSTLLLAILRYGRVLPWKR